MQSDDPDTPLPQRSKKYLDVFGSRMLYVEVGDGPVVPDAIGREPCDWLRGWKAARSGTESRPGPPVPGEVSPWS